MSHARSSMYLSPGNEGQEDPHHSPVHSSHSQPKRKRSSAVKGGERKKVSRACDACKDKKVRCAGTQPCTRCISQTLECLYNKTHRRGNPSPPEPGLTLDGHEQSNTTFTSTPHDRQGRSSSSTNRNPPLGPLKVSDDQRKSSRSSQEADGGRVEGDYIGPSSGIAFMQRAQKRFQQDYAAINSKNAETQGSKQVSVFCFGDGWVPDAQTVFSLPSRVKAKGLLDRYFDFAMPTYRFLHRPTVVIWLNSMYDNNSTGGKLISNARKAIVVLLFATAKLYNEKSADSLQDGQNQQSEESAMYFAEAERLLKDETGPVKVESVQARLAQCIHLLASSRINQAWYIFGNVTQMISALGLHRKQHTNSAKLAPDTIEADCRKQVFWSAYTLDKYLSVILGRPRIIRDEDIDESLPEKVLETGMTGARASLSVSDGPVFHARLAKIIGQISSDIYTSRSKDTEWMASAQRWTRELKQWKESLPAFLEPTKVDPSMLVPIFQRQSTVLSLAYAHAMILANRPALLSNFADLSRWQAIPLGEPTGSLKECIDAALVVVVTVNELIEAGQMPKAFWFTHYTAFCAISALYVYTIQQCLPHQTSILEAASDRRTPVDTRLFDAATKCQKRIEDTTTMTSPFRRYNIILDELKKEVLHCLASEPPHLDEDVVSVTNEQSHSHMMDSSGGTALTTPTDLVHSAPFNFILEQPQPQYQNTQHPPQNGTNNLMDPQSEYDPPSSAIDDSRLMDLGAFGNQGELMGWPEFDSCAINWSEGLEGFDPGI